MRCRVRRYTYAGATALHLCAAKDAPFDIFKLLLRLHPAAASLPCEVQDLYQHEGKGPGGAMLRRSDMRPVAEAPVHPYHSRTTTAELPFRFTQYVGTDVTSAHNS